LSTGPGNQGRDPGAHRRSRLSLRLAMALVLFAAVLLATVVAAGLSRWWVQRDVTRFLDDIGWRPPTMGHGAARARFLREIFATTGFGRRLTDSIIVSGLVGALLAGAVGYFGASWLARPLSTAAGRLRRLAAGDYRRASYDRAGPDSEISEVVAISAAVDTLTAQLQAAEDLRRRLVEDLVHELRSPLTAVRGYAEGIRDGVFPDPALAISGLERELSRIERLLSDLRHSALPSSPGAFVTFDLSEMVQAVAGGFAARAREKQLELEVRAELPGPAILGDPDRLGQVVSNLLDNAVKFTPDGGTVRVEVSTVGDRQGPWLAVQDSGPGIPSADLHHVFDRLYRAEPSRARSTGGSGIGLAIVKQIVLSHGGRVEAQNAPGSGARFVVYLPRAGSAD